MADENENDIDFGAFPSYYCDEHTKDDYVHVVVYIKGLHACRELKFEGFIPKIRKKAKNASVEVTFNNWSLCVTVIGESGDMKWKKKRLDIKQLPYEIIADESYHEVGKNKVELYLRKKIDRSWRPAMRKGLEHAKEEEGTEDSKPQQKKDACGEGNGVEEDGDEEDGEEAGDDDIPDGPECTIDIIKGNEEDDDFWEEKDDEDSEEDDGEDSETRNDVEEPDIEGKEDDCQETHEEALHVSSEDEANVSDYEEEDEC